MDNRIRFLEQDKQALNAKVEEAKQHLHTLRQASESHGTELRQQRAEIDKKELELRAKEQKAEQLSVQLNQVKTNKEYAVLQHEIATLKADASLLEDDTLSILVELDQQEQSRRERETHIRDAEKALHDLAEQVAKKTAELDAALAEVRAERESVVAGVDPELREFYERLFRSRDGRGIVRATPAGGDERFCSGCFIRLTSNTTSLLLLGAGLLRCPSCGRILYIDDEEPEAAEPAE